MIFKRPSTQVDGLFFSRVLHIASCVRKTPLKLAALIPGFGPGYTGINTPYGNGPAFTLMISNPSY